MNDDHPPGLAFDSNLLGNQTQRRLMTLWMESAELSVLVLPSVMEELQAPNMVDRSPTAQRRNALHKQCWNDITTMPDSPFKLLHLDESELEAASEIVRRFTLRCFPKLTHPTQILRNVDAMVIAQAIAAGVDCVVTNNMRSIDHYEINDLVARSMGRNMGIVIEADHAVLQAHAGENSARRLLIVAMASNWPRPGEVLEVDEAHEYVTDLAARLAQGANMPNVADRLVNAFDIEPSLDWAIEQANDLVTNSRMLRCEQHRAHVLRQGMLEHQARDRGHGLPR